MYGWRARLGLVIPTNNTVIEPEFARMVPEGVSTFAARILTGGANTAEGILKMVENSHRAVEELKAGDIGVIGYACLATSLVKGPDWTAGFESSVREKTGKPAITAANATVQALQANKVKRVALATPYPEHFNKLLPGLFNAAGIEIVSLHSVQVQNSLEVCRLAPEIAYKLSREADRKEAQAVCILATDFRTIDVLDDLERDLGKPVVSTNQALLWRQLDLAAVRGGLEGYGSLLRDRPACP